MADAKEGGEPHKENAPADTHVHSEELTGKSDDASKAVTEHASGGAHAVDAHGHDSHGHDDHGHGHDSHAVPADAIPENSVFDSVLPGLAILVGLALTGLIVFWISLKPAAVAEGEGAEHGAVEHAAPANVEQDRVH